MPSIPQNADTKFILLNVSTAAGAPVFHNRKLRLSRSGTIFHSEKLKMEKGIYLVTGVVAVDADDSARYAAPKSGTAKSGTVHQPLSQAVSVNKQGITTVFTELSKIESNDLPSDFGYTNAEFGWQESMEVTIKFQVTVGRALYDSMPGLLKVSASDPGRPVWNREIALQKGVTTIRVPLHATHYQFEAREWNSQGQTSFTRSTITPGMQVLIAAYRAPKRLLAETVYTEQAGGYVPESRTTFHYNSTGRLAEILNYQRSIQVSGLPLTHVYRFVYADGRLDTIRRQDPQNQLTGLTAFTYTGGKISSIHSSSYGQETRVTVQYGQTGDTGKIELDYLFSNGKSMTYRIVTMNGNKIADHAQSATGGGETGRYEYDHYINPRHQLGWPDPYFSDYSKNNLLREHKSYTGNIPSVIPYKTEYRYDTDGYPVEVYTSYMGYTSRQHLYRTRKSYSYQ